MYTILILRSYLQLHIHTHIHTTMASFAYNNTYNNNSAAASSSGAALADAFGRLSSMPQQRRSFQRQTFRRVEMELPFPCNHETVTELCKMSAAFNRRAKNIVAKTGKIFAPVSVVAVNPDGLKSNKNGTVTGPFKVTISSTNEKALGAFMNKTKLYHSGEKWNVPSNMYDNARYNKWYSATENGDKWVKDQQTGIYWLVFQLHGLELNIGVGDDSSGGLDFFLETYCSLQTLMSTNIADQYHQTAREVFKTTGIADGNPFALLRELSSALKPLIPARAPAPVEDDTASVASATSSVGKNSFAALLDEEDTAEDDAEEDNAAEDDAEEDNTPAASTAPTASAKKETKKLPVGFSSAKAPKISSRRKEEIKRNRDETLQFLGDTTPAPSAPAYNAVVAKDEEFPVLPMAGPRHEPTEEEKQRALRATIIAQKRHEEDVAKRKAEIDQLQTLAKRAIEAEERIRESTRTKPTRSRHNKTVHNEAGEDDKFSKEFMTYAHNIVGTIATMCMDTTQTSDPIIIPSGDGNTENPVAIEVDATSPLPEDEIVMLLQQSLVENRPISVIIRNALPETGRSWTVTETPKASMTA